MMNARNFLQLGLLLTAMGLPGGLNAQTKQELDIIRKYDEDIVAGGIHCVAFEVAYDRARAERGLFTARTPEGRLKFGVNATVIYLYKKMPKDELRDAILELLPTYQPMADQLAEYDRLDQGRSPEALALGEKISAGCGREMDAVSDRTEWAIKSGIDLDIFK